MYVIGVPNGSTESLKYLLYSGTLAYVLNLLHDPGHNLIWVQVRSEALGRKMVETLWCPGVNG